MERIACSSRNSVYRISQDHSYSCNWTTSVAKISVKSEDTDSENSSGFQYDSKDPHILIRNKNHPNYADNTCIPQVIHVSISYCSEHSDLFLHYDEKLVKPGDKFDSHNDFIQYLNENAKRWYYYYKCSDSRKPNTENESYLYTCVYLRNKEKYIKKGLRKRTNNIKTNCPCKIKLKRVTNDRGSQLMAVFVCNHHDHPLSQEEFFKLQHGRRLPPYIKEEIMDLLSLQVDMDKIKKYVQIQTGFDMNRTFFYQIERTMRLKNLERQVSDKKLVEFSKKINNMELHTKIPNGINLSHRRKYTRNIKLLPVTKCLEVEDNKSSRQDIIQDATDANLHVPEVNNLQEDAECEIYKNPWLIDHYVLEFPHSTQNQIIKACSSQNDYTLNEDYANFAISGLNENKQDIGDSYVAYETIVTEVVNDNAENDYPVPNENELTCIIKYEEDRIDNNEHEVIKWMVSDNNELVNEETSPDPNIAFGDFIPTDNIHSEVSHEHMKEENIQNTIECDNGSTLDSSTCHIEVQNNDEINSAESLLPVFDVQMTEGNVAEFVANDHVLSHLQQIELEKRILSNDKDNCITTSNICANNSVSESNTVEGYIERISSNTYQKHEYIHKYNINHYMDQPNFLDYIKMLSREIQIDAKQMIKNVRSEKAMFKMTTTQRDKEGDTRIWYLTIRFE